jgi:hypothetical protein
MSADVVGGDPRAFLFTDDVSERDSSPLDNRAILGYTFSKLEKCFLYIRKHKRADDNSDEVYILVLLSVVAHVRQEHARA